VSSTRTAVPDLVSLVANGSFETSPSLIWDLKHLIRWQLNKPRACWLGRVAGVTGHTVKLWSGPGPQIPRGVSYSVIEIVTDDMPFLVDSVTSELTREGRAIQLVAHPLFAVTRDATHELSAIHELDVNEIKRE